MPFLVLVMLLSTQFRLSRYSYITWLPTQRRDTFYPLLKISCSKVYISLHEKWGEICFWKKHSSYTFTEYEKYLLQKNSEVNSNRQIKTRQNVLCGLLYVMLDTIGFCLPCVRLLERRTIDSVPTIFIVLPKLIATVTVDWVEPVKLIVIVSSFPSPRQLCIFVLFQWDPSNIYTHFIFKCSLVSSGSLGIVGIWLCLMSKSQQIGLDPVALFTLQPMGVEGLEMFSSISAAIGAEFGAAADADLVEGNTRTHACIMSL